ncbi:MAG: 4Fe-4S binding protein [Nitrospirales bacterium]|nr:4Fe-4S binding protein [Nitrospirales bacterium]
MQKNTTTDSFWKKYRFWIMGLSILIFMPPLSLLFQSTQDSNFCGSWCPRMFFVWRKGMAMGDYFIGFARSAMGVALVAGIIVTTIFAGRQWCSHICPIGGVMELGSRIVPKWLKIDFSSIPSSSFRYGYLSVYFLASAFGIGSLCCNYCNFATIPRLMGAAFSPADMAYFFRTAGLINLGLVVVLGFLAKGGRAYCNLLCPVGALDALASRAGVSLGRRMRVGNGCDGCGACKRVCPTWAIDVKEKASIDSLSCMPCRECEKACPKGAISLCGK